MLNTLSVDDHLHVSGIFTQNSLVFDWGVQHKRALAKRDHATLIVSDDMKCNGLRKALKYLMIYKQTINRRQLNMEQILLNIFM